jgi:hypothetical protein
MRDEVLGEWRQVEEKYEFHVYVHISGGFVFGWAGMRDKIFRYHLPHTIKVFRYGDNELFEQFPSLDDAPVIIHFNSPKEKYHKIENFGVFNDYK